MTYAELISIVRNDLLDDIVPGSDAGYEDSNWSKSFLLREAINAAKQASYRQDLRHIFDESFRITLKTGVKSYALDPAILRIEEITLNGAPLRHVHLGTLDTHSRGWRDYEAGTPTKFYIRARTLFLDRVPSAAYSGAKLALKVWREPYSTGDIDDEIEWDIDVEKLGHWIAFKAFNRRDEDTQDGKKAAEHLMLFNMAFGDEVPARVRMELLQTPPTVTFSPQIDYPYDHADQSDYTGRW